MSHPDILFALNWFLISDESLVKNHSEFCDKLGVPLDVKTLLEIPWQKLKPNESLPDYNTNGKTFSIFDYFAIILSDWICRNGENATMGKLQEILREMAVENKASPDTFEKMINCSLKLTLETRITTMSGGIYPKDGNFIEKSDIVSNFTGRERELDRLKNIIENDKDHGVVIVISGPSGIGKTQLVKKFLNDIISTSKDTSTTDMYCVTWLSGETPNSLKSSVTAWANKLKINSTCNGESLNVEHIISKIYEKYIRHTITIIKFLVVIDNMDEIHELLVKTILNLTPFSLLILISRRNDIYPGQMESLELTPMKSQDAKNFLNKSLEVESFPNSEEQIVNLCKQVGNLPIALQQIVVFARERVALKGDFCDLEDYLSELKQIKNSNLEGYSERAMNVFEVSLKTISKNYGDIGKVAVDLIQILCFFNSEKLNPAFIQKVYSQFYPNEVENAEIRKSLELLATYSLIEIDENSCRVHGLIQKFIRYKIISSGKRKTTTKLKTRIFKLFGVPQAPNIFIDYDNKLSCFWELFNTENFDHDEILHIISLWKYSATNPKLVKLHHNIPTRISFALDHFSMLDLNYEFIFESHNSLVKLLGANHESCLELEYFVSESLIANGYYGLSLILYRDLYRRVKYLHGEEDFLKQYWAFYISNRLNFKQPEERLEFSQSVLESSSRLLGKHHKDTVEAKLRLAEGLRCLNRAEEASKLYQEVCIWHQRNLGNDHQKTLNVTRHTGNCLRECGKYSQAKLFYENALKQQEQKFGSGTSTGDPDHHQPAITHTKRLIARVMNEKASEGKAATVMQITKCVSPIGESCFNQKNPEALRAKLTIADRLQPGASASGNCEKSGKISKQLSF